MKKIIQNLIEFVRSPYAPPFALLLLNVGLTYTYFKLYLIVNEIPKDNIFTIENLISFVMAWGLSFVTIAVIIHSQNKYVPLLFASMDFAGNILFYANNYAQWYEAGHYPKIFASAFISLFLSSAVYTLAEIFNKQYDKKAEIEEENDSLNRQVVELKERLATNHKLMAKRQEEYDKDVLALNNQLDYLEGCLLDLDTNLQESLSEIGVVRGEKERYKSMFEELDAKKNAFISENKDSLEGKLQGAKNRFTRAKNSNEPEKLSTLPEIRKEIIFLSDSLGLGVEDKYLNFDILEVQETPKEATKSDVENETSPIVLQDAPNEEIVQGTPKEAVQDVQGVNMTDLSQDAPKEVVYIDVLQDVDFSN